MGWLDKLKNKSDETQGAAKEFAGKVTGDKKVERKGKTAQTKSNLKAAGDQLLGSGTGSLAGDRHPMHARSRERAYGAQVVPTLARTPRNTCAAAA